MKFFYLLGFAISSYLIYKYKKRDRRNNLLLVHSNSKLAKFFKLITDNFIENYAEGLFYSGHAQTFLLEVFDKIVKILKNYLNVFKFKFHKREMFKLSDGGTIAVDYTKCLEGIFKNRNKILVVVPGFTSLSDDYYIKNFLNDFVEEFDCRVMNVRGFGTKLTSPVMVSTYCCNDVREYLEYTCKANPDKKVFAMGFSFGGMMLARCLGSYDNGTMPQNLIGGCGLCYPISLHSVKNHVENQLGGFYSKYGTRNLKKCFLENIDVIFDNTNPQAFNHTIIHEKDKIIEQINNLEHVADFDKIYTYKLLKFKSCEEYFSDSDLSKYLGNIKIPFLSIFTKDDPIIPYEGIPIKFLQKNPNLITIISNKGGHMGFFTGLLPQRWIDIPIKTFYKTVEIIHDVEDRPDLSKSISSDEDYFRNFDDNVIN